MLESKWPKNRINSGLFSLVVFRLNHPQKLKTYPIFTPIGLLIVRLGSTTKCVRARSIAHPTFKRRECSMRSMLCVFLVACLASIAVDSQGAMILAGTSHSIDFNSIGSGIPSGVTVRTGATSSALGDVGIFSTSTSSWGTASGNFRNVASSDGTTLGSDAGSTDQSNFANRAIGLRQTGDFGDPGAALTFQIQDTLGFENFTWKIDVGVLDIETRTTPLSFQVAMGDTPTTFTTLGVLSPENFGLTTQTFNLSSGVENSAQTLWLRVAALSATTGSGSRDTIGFDNFVLTYSDATAVPEPSSLLVAAIGCIGGVVARYRRRKSAVESTTTADAEVAKKVARSEKRDFLFF